MNQTSQLGTFRALAAMELNAAANRRRHASALAPHASLRPRLIESAKWQVNEARRCRLLRQAAMQTCD